MANESSNSTSGGIGFLGLLTILFIALKLLGVIAWPWVWVLAPLWIPTVLVVIVLVAIFILALIFGK